MVKSTSPAIPARLEINHIHLASFLLAKQHTLIGIELGTPNESGKRFAVFFFQPDHTIEHDITAYWQDGLIGVESFCKSLRALRQMLRNSHAE